MKCYANIKFDDRKCCFTAEPRSIIDNIQYGMTVVRQYSDIARYEYLEDNETVSSGGFGLGRAIVGGMVFGPVGAIVGGLTKGRKTETYLSSVSVVITFKKSEPITIEYLPKEREKAIQLISKLDQACEMVSHAFDQDGLPVIENKLEWIPQKQEKAKEEKNIAIDRSNMTPHQQKVMQELDESNSYMDEIKELKKLYDEGFITKDEFSARKGVLLGITGNEKVKRIPIKGDQE